MDVINYIINFETDSLKEKLDAANEQFENDSIVQKLDKKIRFCGSFPYILALFLVAVSLAIVLLCDFQSSTKLFIFLGIGIVWTVSFFKCLFTHLDFVKRKNEFFDACYTSSLSCYALIFGRKALACYGKPLEDGKFEVTFVVEADEEDKKSMSKESDVIQDTFIFDFDASNPDGILTLDVEKGLVFYTSDVDA